VTPEKLAQIDQAEMALYEAGFRQVRVRHHGELARIEVPPSDLSRFFSDGINVLITSRLKAIGFRHVTLDLQGYRSGSLNEGLSAAIASAGTPAIGSRRVLPVVNVS